jgi:Survival motor neuron (SMN) interacting protein 1 (SIP1)
VTRSEALAAPSLLVAVTNPQHDQTDRLHDKNGVSEEPRDKYISFDEAYGGVAIKHGDCNILSPVQEQYYQILLDRFHALRSALEQPPPLQAIKDLSMSRPITLPSESKIAKDAWERHIIYCQPHPVQVASMDSVSVLNVLRLLSSRLRSFLNEGPIPRIGTWAWALLARSPDRGMLGSEEVAELREFALKAITLLKEGEVNDTPSGYRHEEDEEDDEAEEDFGQAIREALLARAEMRNEKQSIDNISGDSEFRWSKSSVLDMVITVVGEVYGQRDLLEKRPCWSNDENTLQDWG